VLAARDAGAGANGAHGALLGALSGPEAAGQGSRSRTGQS
jgi:hypothetical protein